MFCTKIPYVLLAYLTNIACFIDYLIDTWYNNDWISDVLLFFVSFSDSREISVKEVMVFH